MSVEAGADPNSSMEVETRGSNEGHQELVRAISEESVVLDQIILAPEIMNIILKFMDFRSLKNSRLVCKSWLHAAQFQVESRGIVQLRWPHVQKFLATLNSQEPDLPQPFRSIGLNVKNGLLVSPNPVVIVDQISELCSSFAITRVSLRYLHLNLIFPLIIRCSPNLEYLELFDAAWDPPGPPLDPKHTFAKLRHLKVNDHTQHSIEDLDRNVHFSSVISWIIGASPSLDTFESWSGNILGFWTTFKSQVLLKVHDKQLKSFSSFHIDVERAVFKHFLPTPTAGPEKFRMRLDHGILHCGDIIVATVSKCTATLRAVDFWWMGLPEISALPACPNILELTVISFYESSSLMDRFPSLQSLSIKRFHVDVLGYFWRDLSPYLGLKTLRVKHLSLDGDGDDRDETLPARFFEKFPVLERLLLSSSAVLRFCRMKATGDPRYSNMLEEVKHLELRGCHLFGNLDPENSSLAVLKGLETITMLSGCDVDVLSRISKLPFLKVLEFALNSDHLCSSLDKLMEIAGSMEKIVITNCCKVFWTYSSSQLLTRSVAVKT